jgi:hypothetical protein
VVFWSASLLQAVAEERPSRWRGASNAVEPVAAMDSQVRPSSFQWRGAESSGVSLARTSIMLARSMDKENAAPRAAAPSRGRMALKDSAQHNMVSVPNYTSPLFPPLCLLVLFVISRSTVLVVATSARPPLQMSSTSKPLRVYARSSSALVDATMRGATVCNNG